MNIHMFIFNSSPTTVLDLKKLKRNVETVFVVEERGENNLKREGKKWKNDSHRLHPAHLYTSDWITLAFDYGTPPRSYAPSFSSHWIQTNFIASWSDTWGWVNIFESIGHVDRARRPLGLAAPWPIAIHPLVFCYVIYFIILVVCL